MAVRLMLLVYALTLFASATLLFVLEPLVGKMILPRLGGSPAVWNTCVVFFQAILLAGYAYAHASVAWLGVRRQAYLHLGLLSAALVFLLASPSPLWLHHRLLKHAAEQPVLGLLACLSVSYSIPLFVVCTSAPLLQKWFSSTSHPAASDPYFLYGASNLGSMLALLSYPTLLEPYLHLAQQRWLWLAGYGLLLVLTAVCALYLWRSAPAAAADEEISPDELEDGIGGLRRLRWLVLAFVPSSLMLGATTTITTDVAAIPLLWVLPLGLYLLSFILVFAHLPSSVHSLMVLLFPLLVLLVLFFGIADIRTQTPIVPMVLHLAMLFVVSMVCHGELARDRPSTRYLTGYFLWISVGGVTGGLFNSLIAPVVFRSLAEYPLVLVLACLLMPPIGLARLTPGGRRVDAALVAGFVLLGGLLAILSLRHLNQVGGESLTVSHLADGWGWTLSGALALLALGAFRAASSHEDRTDAWLDLALPAGVAMLTIGLVWGVTTGLLTSPLRGAASFLHAGSAGKLGLLLAYGLPALICYTLIERPQRFGLGVAAYLLAATFATRLAEDALWQGRSFFGVLRVEEMRETSDGASLLIHRLMHGTTLHGTQFQNQNLQDIPLTYYHRTGPVGQLCAVYNTDPQRSLGVIGLGTGSMACYALPGQHLTFYEIDSLVRDLTFADDSAYFTYVHNARQRGAEVDLVLGDARVEMDRQKLAEADRFGILVIDAFSSDAIPIHLITREAIEVYLNHLADDGILAFHISSRHLNLEPVLGNLARDLGLAGLVQHDTDSSWPGKRTSKWVVLARRPEHLGRLLTPQRWLEVVPPLQHAFVTLSALPAAGPGISSHALMLVSPLDDIRPPWSELQPNFRGKVGVWTDDYSNVISVIVWRRGPP